ncbi:MAG: bifunctional precorrin-2 dehydrogenase/sirohydrochlorin ferrochelatase, partial [Chitinophagaceae bacterium]
MEEKKEGNDLFPVFLKLEHLKVLIVGGGKIGLEKLHAVVHNSPATTVTLVAEEVSHAIKTLAEHYTNIYWQERSFVESDLEEQDIVIIAVNSKEVSSEIHAAAKRKDKLVNVADTPHLCDFYLSSIVKKGNLKIAISTNGKSPTAAKRIKEVLQDALPGELEEVINNLHHVRNKLNGNFDYKVKKLNALTKILVEGDSSASERRWKKIASYSVGIFAVMLIGHFIFSYIPLQSIADETVTFYKGLDKN